MTTEEYLSFIVKEIHTTVVATVDDEGLPVTSAIDMVDHGTDSLYFLTAKGKSFYNRLKQQGFLAFTAVKGEDTMSSVAVSVRAKVREVGFGKVPELFRNNPYLAKIYPTEISRQTLTVFQVYEGTGEWFDLREKPVRRETFSFGGAEKKVEGYYITDACIGCGTCASVCPQNCIITGKTPLVISQEHCLRCGNCMTECPAEAIEWRRI